MAEVSAMQADEAAVADVTQEAAQPHVQEIDEEPPVPGMPLCCLGTYSRWLSLFLSGQLLLG